VPLKVLFLTTNWPRPDSPVDGIFVREHARAAAEVADVRVVHLERAAGEGLVDLRRIPDEEPPAWRARYRRFGKPVSVAGFVLGPLVAAERFARRGWRPDVIHAHSFLSALPALALGKRLRVPVAYTEHWTVFLPENPLELTPAMRLAARIALRGADLVLPVSGDLGEALRRLEPRARTRVVPNVVDENVFATGPPRTTNGPRRLLTAGLLDTERKGVDVLLEAFALLRERNGVVLDVVGDGSLRPRYEELAERLGVRRAVTFHGLMPKAELAAQMRAADLFVLASRYENNPCVVLEAMATGLPVVATRVGGLPEVVDGHNGSLAPPNDPQAFASELETALARLDGFDRDEIARRTVERFGREAVGRQLAAVYEELAGRS
jgi:glycosyltransferase involved in cell wall biosynthesis